MPSGLTPRRAGHTRGTFTVFPKVFRRHGAGMGATLPADGYRVDQALAHGPGPSGTNGFAQRKPHTMIIRRSACLVGPTVQPPLLRVPTTMVGMLLASR